MKLKQPFVIAASILALCLVSGCINIAGEWHYEEIERVKSPDGVVEAVIVRGGGGATTGFTCSIFIVLSGTPFAEKSALFEQERASFRADHWDNLKVVWKRPKFLEIRFDKARIFTFSNHWNEKEVQNYGYVVELRLVPLDGESSLTERDKI